LNAIFGDGIEPIEYLEFDGKEHLGRGLRPIENEKMSIKRLWNSDQLRRVLY